MCDENSGTLAEVQQPAAVSRNLRDQRLGLKGRKTREKLVDTALRMLESADETPVILSGVAREASIALTTLYLYFPDLGELLLAVLEKVMDSAEAAFVARLRKRWPDDSLQESCLDFLLAHYQFWRRNSRVLLMRNSFADSGDVRLFEYRLQVSQPLAKLLIYQMDCRPDEVNTNCQRFATLLLTGFERLATVITAPMYRRTLPGYGVADEAAYINRLLNTEAELLAMTIRHQRNVEKSSSTAGC